jgi:flavin-dependent dehydrogenase
VLLVGEAAGIDIATGEGIAQAIAYGRLAADYLAAAFRSGDLSFADWRDRVWRDQLGWNLAFRRLLYRGLVTDRARTEGLIVRNPYLLQLFAQEFAGRRLRVRSAARAAARLQWREAPWYLRLFRESFLTA